MRNYLIGGLVVLLASIIFVFGFTPTRNAILGINTNANTITNGTDGKSAYDLAVENGFEGTVTEWLASLQGSNGTDGVSGNMVEVFKGNLTNEVNTPIVLTETYDVFLIDIYDNDVVNDLVVLMAGSQVQTTIGGGYVTSHFFHASHNKNTNTIILNPNAYFGMSHLTFYAVVYGVKFGGAI